MKNSLTLTLISLMSLSFLACASTPSSTDAVAGASAPVSTDARELGLSSIHKMAGCYIVDYSYSESEVLKKGYKLDGRVYDVNKNKTVKEWIYPQEISPNRVRLQHVMFFTDAAGKMVPGSELKHHAEDWEYTAPFWYEFTAPNTWQVTKIDPNGKTWLRRITNLDDGLRYQCAAAWTAGANPEWKCDNYAPIPGRETRDMKRKDYQTLDRSTRVIVYGDSWLERQENVKTIHDAKGRAPLVKELGKNWYVRVPDQECSEIRAWMAPQQEFWALLRETWDDELNGQGPVVEAKPDGQPPRFVKMGEVEEKYLKADLKNPEVREKARAEILQVIANYKKASVDAAAAAAAPAKTPSVKK